MVQGSNGACGSTLLSAAWRGSAGHTQARAIFGKNRIACAIQQASSCWAHCLYKAELRRSPRNFTSTLAGQGVQGELPQTLDDVVTFLPLEEACDAGRRVSDQTLVACALHDAVDTSNPSTISERIYSDEKAAIYLLKQGRQMEQLHEACKQLLQATQNTVTLAPLIVKHPADGRVLSLHRSFWTLFQKCVEKLATAPHTTSKSASFSALLEGTLRLAVRAREDFGFTLPISLYRDLATCVCVSPSEVKTTMWLLQIIRWIVQDFGNLPSNFLHQPLSELAQRRHFDIMVALLIQVFHKPDTSVKFLDEVTLQAIFRPLYEDFRAQVWEAPTRKGRRAKTRLLMEELLLLLEPSVWRLFGYCPSSPEHQTTLREAVDVLLLSSTNESTQKETPAPSLPGTQEILQALFPDEYSDKWDSEEDDWESSRGDSDNYTAWEYHIDMDADTAIVGMTRYAQEADANHDDQQTIATSKIPTSKAWHRVANVPDVVSQIEEATGRSLQYSESLKQDLLHSFGEQQNLEEYDSEEEEL